MRTAWLAVAVTALSGCATGPLIDNPMGLNTPEVTVENPVFLPQGPLYYNALFGKVLDIVDDYFPIAVMERYDGRIETFPAISPGLEQWWKPGSPDFDQRLQATLQTIRHRAVILIKPADDGGYFVQVTVYKELEDLPRPVRQTAGDATFRQSNTVERQFEVIDPTVFESMWIPIGRDFALEQEILRKIKACK
jgi:hypothetical protein